MKSLEAKKEYSSVTMNGPYPIVNGTVKMANYTLVPTCLLTISAICDSFTGLHISEDTPALNRATIYLRICLDTGKFGLNATVMQ